MGGKMGDHIVLPDCFIGPSFRSSPGLYLPRPSTGRHSAYDGLIQKVRERAEPNKERRH